MISIIMGSDSDLPIVKKTIETLQQFGVHYDVQILSAHRTPDAVKSYVTSATQKGSKVFIGVAGKAAHLPGVIAAYTTRAVIGLPIKTDDLGGLDSLYSMVQMPAGVPVATVAINGAVNAALLAIQMLAVGSEELDKRLQHYKKEMQEKVLLKNAELATLAHHSMET